MRALLLLVATMMFVAAAPARVATPAPPTPTTNPASAGPVGAQPLTRQDVEPWLDGFMPYALASGDIPGAVVTIVKDGHVVVAKGYGLADAARHIPIDPYRTLFRAGSVSKLFTWTAVMQLVEQGRIDLDADVNRYLDFRIPSYGGHPITMRNLMTHTAGFEEARRGIATTLPGPPGSLDAALRDNVPARIFAPGSTPAYSNYGAAVAGYIVARISGEPFERYVSEHVLGPLGMRRTTFVQPLPAALAPDAAKGYLGDGVTPGAFETVVWRPAGAISTTGDDMARFMIAHLQNGAFSGTRILAAPTARAMHNTPYGGDSWLNRMRLGFYDIDINGHRVVGHHGDTVLFHAMLALFIDDHVGIFMAFNGAGRAGAVGTVREQLFERFADRYFPDPASRPAWLDARTAQAHDRMFAGSYESSRGYFTSFLTFTRLLDPTRVIVHQDGTVSLSGYKGPDGEPKRFREVAPFHWRQVDGHDRLMGMVSDGLITKVSANGFAPVMVFEAVPGWRSPVTLARLFAAGAVATLLYLLAWPIGAAIRRYYAVVPRDPPRVWSNGLSRASAALLLAALGGWAWLLARILSPTGIYMLAQFGAGILLIQAATLLGSLGVIAGLAYRLVGAEWSRDRWLTRTAEVAVLLAVSGLLYTAVAYRMVTFSTAF